MNILLAPNSFKESADSTVISKKLAKEFNEHPSLKIIEKPLSDGGDGFLSVCQSLFNCELITYYIPNVYSRELCPVIVGYSQLQAIIYIESAEIVGLKKVPEPYRNPLKLNTNPLGFLLKLITEDVLQKKIVVNEVLLGVGGTATVDFGLGAAEAFGLKIFDFNKKELKIFPYNYKNISSLFLPSINLPFKLKVVADVTTPLLGEKNAIELYSGQKGATNSDIFILLKGFNNLHKIFKNKGLSQFSDIINGAGGGLSAGLKIFFNAEIISSEDFIYATILKNIDINDIDTVITGEGAFDEQSFEDKGAYLIIKRFNRLKIPIFLICGTITPDAKQKLPECVTVVEIQNFFKSREESIKNIELGLQKAAKMIITRLKN